MFYESLEEWVRRCFLIKILILKTSLIHIVYNFLIIINTLRYEVEDGITGKIMKT